MERPGDGLLVWSSDYWLDRLPGLKEPSDTWSRIEVPAVRREWVRGTVVDLRPLLLRKGAELKRPDTLVVFDLGSERVTVAGAPEDIDLVESFVTSGISDPINGPDIWVENNPEVGGWGLTCRSACDARIEKTSPAGNGPSFEVELQASLTTSLVDLRYDFDVFSKGAPAGHLKSSTTMERGKPQEIAGHSADGKEEKVILTVSEN